ncbi:hypothetical protein SFRURICE_014002 [Spodoptera frugiperda]|nr:hypothetical protein SFRURICE_014002 [Spodoptera frugiperda]
MTSPTTNTCPNTLSYLYDSHSWTEYASYFFNIFKYISRAFQLHGKHGVQNLTLVDFYTKSLVYAEGIGRASKFFSKTYLKIMAK